MVKNKVSLVGYVWWSYCIYCKYTVYNYKLKTSDFCLESLSCQPYCTITSQNSTAGTTPVNVTTLPPSDHQHIWHAVICGTHQSGHL